MKKRNPIAIRIEYIGIIICYKLLPLMSRKMIVWLAKNVSMLARFFARKDIRIAKENIQFVFGDRVSAKEQHEYLKKAFFNYTLMFFDLFWFSKDTEQRINTYIKKDSRLSVLEDDVPTLALTGHYGNWEVLGQAVNIWGFPLKSIAKPINNPLVNRFFIQLREQSGQSIIPTKGAMRELFRQMRKPGSKVAILLDQNTLPKEGGLFVPFFGLEVPVSSAPAAIVYATRCQVAVGFCTPDPNGVYTAFTTNVIKPEGEWETLDKETFIKKMTMKLTSEIEQQILRAPGYWLWSYKRWKYIPEGSSRDEYLSYSRRFKPHEKAL